MAEPVSADSAALVRIGTGKPGPGRRPAFTPEEVAAAISENHGVIAGAARSLGCSRDTVERYVDRHAVVRAAFNEARELIVDMAEAVVIKRLGEGDLGAAKFVLSTIGRDRGWGRTVPPDPPEHGSRPAAGLRTDDPAPSTEGPCP